jgi:hypothetical protein
MLAAFSEPTDRRTTMPFFTPSDRNEPVARVTV